MYAKCSQRNFVTNEFREIETKRISLFPEICGHSAEFRYAEWSISCYETKDNKIKLREKVDLYRIKEHCLHFFPLFRIRIRPDRKLFGLKDPELDPDPLLFHTKHRNML